MARTARRTLLAALTLVGAAAALPASAQEYGVYLLCKGQIEVQGRTTEAHLDMALRRNSYLALVQRSNVLPVNLKGKMEISPAFYSMLFVAPTRDSVVWYDWIRGALFIWAPDLKRLHTARVSVDRQTAALEGEMLDGAGAAIGKLAMHCEPKTNNDIAAPKF
ncbi:MAG: hypothetical protein JSR59_10750 [Proteobacteria bacterium]|nr:hypothetical protein [Pseudomonadota bacterium]